MTGDTLAAAKTKADELKGSRAKVETQSAKAGEMTEFVNTLMVAAYDAGVPAADANRLKQLFDAELVTIAMRLAQVGK